MLLKKLLHRLLNLTTLLVSTFAANTVFSATDTVTTLAPTSTSTEVTTPATPPAKTQAVTPTKTQAPTSATDDGTSAFDPLGCVNKFKRNLENSGIAYNNTNENIEITIDEKKTLDALPNLVSQGVVSLSDAAVVNTAPLSVSVVIAGITSTMNIVNDTFQRNPQLSKVHVQGFVLPLNGADKKPCYTFDYERSKFSMLDLGVVTPRTFITQTPNFAFSTWCMRNLTQEGVNLNQ